MSFCCKLPIDFLNQSNIWFNIHQKLSDKTLDDLSEEKFSNFYDFMLEYFPQQCKQYFYSEGFKLSITAWIFGLIIK